MKIEASLWSKDTIGLAQAGLQKGEVIIEEVFIGFGADFDGFVTLTLKTGTVAVLAAFGFNLGAGLDFAGVEGRIDVDQINTFSG